MAKKDHLKIFMMTGFGYIEGDCLQHRAQMAIWWI